MPGDWRLFLPDTAEELRRFCPGKSMKRSRCSFAKVLKSLVYHGPRGRSTRSVKQPFNIKSFHRFAERRCVKRSGRTELVISGIEPGSTQTIRSLTRSGQGFESCTLKRRNGAPSSVSMSLVRWSVGPTLDAPGRSRQRCRGCRRLIIGRTAYVTYWRFTMYITM